MIGTKTARKKNERSEENTRRLRMDRGHRQTAGVMSAAPLVLSTPAGLLAENRITDKRYLFVRNIQDLAVGMTMEPLPLEGWEIELVGADQSLSSRHSR